MEFDYNNVTYVIDKLNVLDQFHISAKLLPIFSVVATAGQKNETEAFSQMSLAISKMSKEESNTVLLGLLEAVKKKEGSSYFKIAKDGVLMYQNLDLSTMLYLCFKSMQHNLSDFFASLPRLLEDATPTPKDQ